MPAAPLGSLDAPFLAFAPEDPAKIVTAEACGECHLAEHEVWKASAHATGFRTLHRRERAQEIAGKMGFRLIKRDSLCFSCHYTARLEDGELRVVSGVSCESCHGAARDWIDVHNDYGPGANYAGESAEHRRQRIDASRAAGMRRPSDLYPVAANCFGCHTVPNERLVNEGGHSTGSAAFELVAWSGGELRHNFLDSFRRQAAPVNAPPTPERRREMYVAGRALELEHALRGMAKATGDGIYAKAMARKVRSALVEVRAIAGATAIPEVEAMVEAVRGVRAVPGNGAALAAAAEEVGRSARRFLDAWDGARLAALDPLVEGRAARLAEADAAPAGEGAASPVAAAPQPGSAPAPGAAVSPTPATPAGPAPTPAPGAPAAAGRPAVAAPSPAAAGASGASGEVRRRLRQPSRFATIGPSHCSGCHAPQNAWWFNDPHYASADPFFDGATKNLQIARLYGLSPAEVTRGDRLCMDCHGTVVSGQESREVLDGVSCEGCHGAAAEWLEPHKQGEGRDRPAFAAALERGKADLRRPAVRAEACAACHLITDPRLLSSGHPSGSSFDYLAGLEKTRHWSYDVPEGEMRRAFDTALAARGPVPRVRVATVPAAAAAPAAQAARRVAHRPRRSIRATRAPPARSPRAPPRAGRRAISRPSPGASRTAGSPPAGRACRAPPGRRPAPPVLN